MALTFDIGFLKSHLLEDLNKTLTEAAEPVIQDTLKQIEITMRKTLAANLISMLKHNINFEMDQQQLLIRLNHE